MLTANSVIRKELFQVSSNENVIVGDNNWLYYSACLNDYQHRNSMSDRELFIAAHNLHMIQESLERQGKRFLFTIAPDKCTLYDQNMPERYQITYAARSDLERLTDYLAGEGVHYADLEKAFRQSGEVLYYERDSHWNGKGAVLAYNTLLDAAGKKHETYQDKHPSETMDYYGDLGRMLYPAGLYPELRQHYMDEPLYTYVTPTQSVEEEFIETENVHREGSLMMYRDSFGNSLLALMAQEFSQAVFSSRMPYELSLADEADLVILEKVERHLSSLASVVPLMWGPEFPMPEEAGQAPPLTDMQHDDAPEAMQEAGEEKAQDIWRPYTPGYEAWEEQAGSGNRIHISTDLGYYEITGVAQDRDACVDSRIVLSLTDYDGTKYYEAFLLGTDTSEYAFCLYLPVSAVEGDVLETGLYLMNPESCRIIFALRSEDYDTYMDAKIAREQALRDSFGDVTDQTADVLITALEEIQEEDRGISPNGSSSDVRSGGDVGSGGTEVSRQYVEDCGQNKGYWDILYDDGHHEYLDEDGQVYAETAVDTDTYDGLD